MNISEISMEILSGGQSQKVAIGVASAATAAITAAQIPTGQVAIPVVFTPDVDCFVRRGTNPTAVADGTDQLVKANNAYRCQMIVNEKLAFITASGSGNVYFTPGA